MKDDIRELLVPRRARATPEQAGISRGGEDRRVPGLRREEVAEISGVSTDHYTRLEREHLHVLARGPHANGQPPQPGARLRGSVRRVLDGMSVPALVGGLSTGPSRTSTSTVPAVWPAATRTRRPGRHLRRARDAG